MLHSLSIFWRELFIIWQPFLLAALWATSHVSRSELSPCIPLFLLHSMTRKLSDLVVVLPVTGRKLTQGKICTGSETAVLAGKICFIKKVRTSLSKVFPAMTVCFPPCSLLELLALTNFPRGKKHVIANADTA